MSCFAQAEWSSDGLEEFDIVEMAVGEGVEVSSGSAAEVEVARGGCCSSVFKVGWMPKGTKAIWGVVVAVGRMGGGGLDMTMGYRWRRREREERREPQLSNVGSSVQYRWPVCAV